MSVMFSKKPGAFANFAEHEYDILSQAYNKTELDLIDKTKKEVIRELKGGLVCFCYVLEGYVNSDPQLLDYLK